MTDSAVMVFFMIVAVVAYCLGWKDGFYRGKRARSGGYQPIRQPGNPLPPPDE